jgi:Cdc6-like AAA superfamily ATPase
MSVYALNLTEKLVLLAVLVETEYGSVPSTTGKVYARYVELSKLAGVTYVTKRRMQDVLKSLAKSGVLRVRVQSFGMYGKTSIIVLRQPPHSLCPTLVEDLLIGEVAEEVCRDATPPQ